MQAVPIDLGPYTGGVNLVDPESKLKPDELRVARNFRIGVRGDFYKRPGHDYYVGNSGVSGKVNGDALVNFAARYYKSDGTKIMLAAAGGKLRRRDDADGTWDSISINGVDANMHLTNLCDYAIYKDRIYICDGVAVQRYNGTDDIFAGHFIHAAPTLAQSNTVNGALTLLGTYKYRVASVAGDMGEGPFGAEASIPLTGSNDTVDLSAMAAALAKYEETAKRIYRTKAGGTDFFFLAEIPTGTTTYQDIIADTGLGEPYVPVIAPPANARFVIIGHDERAYWFGMADNASLVYVSDVGFPDRIPATSFFTIRNNDGDILTGAGLVPGGIGFVKKNSFHLSAGFGTGLINIAPRDKRGTGTGTISPFSIVWTPVGLIFLSQNREIYRFDGTNLYEIGRKVGSEFKGMTTNALAKVVACYHDYRYTISYDYRGQRGYNWKTLEYDTVADKWEGPHESGTFYNPSYYAVLDSQLDKGELYWGEGNAASGSYVYERSEFTIYDRGEKFLSTFRSGALPLAKLGDIVSIKTFIEGEFGSDVRLTFSHIDEAGLRTSVEMSVPVPTDAARFNDGVSAFFPAVAPKISAKFGSTKTQILEGPLGASARSRIPKFEISDGGIASRLKINNMSLLLEAEPLA
jgi:hypothetical protein